MEATERLKFGEVYANCEAEEVVNGYHAGWRESGLVEQMVFMVSKNTTIQR